MSDPYFQVEYRPRDSDNDVLRKLLNALNSVSTDDRTALRVSGGGGGGSSTSRALSVTVATGAGTTTAGSTTLGFAVTGTAAATVAGALVPSGTAFSIDAPDGDTIGAVSYDATGTALVITRLA
jgi:hypothetical protein